MGRTISTCDYTVSLFARLAARKEERGRGMFPVGAQFGVTLAALAIVALVSCAVAVREVPTENVYTVIADFGFGEFL